MYCVSSNGCESSVKPILAKTEKARALAGIKQK